MCHFNGSDTLVITLTIFFLLQHSIIASLKHKTTWKKITLLTNLQKQNKMLNYVWKEFKNIKCKHKFFCQIKSLPYFCLNIQFSKLRHVFSHFFIF
jgi:hypothetical protein